MKLIAAILLILLATPVFALEASYDNRSYLHLGASFVIGTGINQALIAGNANRTGRIIFTSATCLGIGAIKEFGFDYYPDYGDLAFDVIGCGLAIGLTETLAIKPKKNGLAFEGSF